MKITSEFITALAIVIIMTISNIFTHCAKNLRILSRIVLFFAELQRKDDRSCPWDKDLWAGFPTNLAGIELLKKLVASETNMNDGPMYVYSAGAHIYGYHEEIARLRTLKPSKTNSP